jgi:hypothetical protein
LAGPHRRPSPARWGEVDRVTLVACSAVAEYR